MTEILISLISKPSRSMNKYKIFMLSISLLAIIFESLFILVFSFPIPIAGVDDLGLYLRVAMIIFVLTISAAILCFYSIYFSIRWISLLFFPFQFTSIGIQFSYFIISVIFREYNPYIFVFYLAMPLIALGLWISGLGIVKLAFSNESQSEAPK